MAKKKADNPKRAEYYQSNVLVQARKHYGIIEHRLFRLALSACNPEFKGSKFYDTEFKPFHLDALEVRNLFDQEDKRIYEKLTFACHNMVKSYIEVGNAKEFLLFPVFEYIEFSVEKGLDLKFNARMKPFILELSQGNYTQSFLQLSFALSGKRALTLLELMLQYRGKAKGGIIERTIDVDELRFAFDVDDNAYKGRMNNFKQIVLNPAIKEINEKTDYYIDPEYDILYGRYKAIKSFTFRMRVPKNEKLFFSGSAVQAEPEKPTNKKTAPADAELSPLPKSENADFANAKIHDVHDDFTEEEIKIIIDLGKLGIKADISIEKLREVGAEYIKYWLAEMQKAREYIKNPAGFILSKLENPEDNKTRYKDEDFIKAYQDIQTEKRKAELKKQEEEEEKRKIEKREAEERRAKRTEFDEEKIKYLVKIYKENDCTFPPEVVEFLNDNYWTTSEFSTKYWREILEYKKN